MKLFRDPGEKFTVLLLVALGVAITLGVQGCTLQQRQSVTDLVPKAQQTNICLLANETFLEVEERELITAKKFTKMQAIEFNIMRKRAEKVCDPQEEYVPTEEDSKQLRRSVLAVQSTLLLMDD